MHNHSHIKDGCEASLAAALVQGLDVVGWKKPTYHLFAVEFISITIHVIVLL
jgi:hypothetical protein